MNIEREEDRIDQAYQRGELTDDEYKEEIKLFRQECRMMAEEAAQEAYDNTLNGYY